MDGPNEIDVHSNYIHGGGSFTLGCVNSGALILSSLAGATPPTAPLGIYRNNIMEAGECTTAITVWELDVDADPRFLENNDLLWLTTSTALYRDEGTTDAADAAAVNALTSPTSSIVLNIDDDPLLPGAATPDVFRNLPAGSMCIDAGTTAGAPSDDYEGQSRPQGAAPDIGPDEF